MVYLIRRFFAIYVDGIIIFISTNCIEIICQVWNGVEVSKIKTPDLNNLLILSICFLYFCLSEFYFSRTFGKRMLQLQIIGYQEPKGIKRLTQVLIRNVIRLIPIEPFSIFLNEEHRMWHDIASKTTVIDVRKVS